MTLNIGDKAQSLLRSERARCYFLWHVYVKENFRPSSYFSFQEAGFVDWALDTALEILQWRNRCYLVSDQTRSDCIKYVQQVEHESKLGLISIEQFDWMKDDRACYFVWLNLKQFTYTNTNTNTLLTIPINCYQQHGLTPQPTSTEERFKTIIQFLDLYMASKELKLGEIERLKGNWQRVFDQKENPFPSLNKNNEKQCKWAWSYCKKFDILHSFSLNPINNSECYHAFYAFYDTWNANDDKKEVFKIKLNKAWSQKKHRHEQVTSKDKISTSVYLDSKTKEQLDTLTKEQNRTMAEIIDYLIRKEYSSTRSS